MKLEHLFRFFDRDIFTIPSRLNLFNMYLDRIDSLDLPDAPQIRKANLRYYLDSYKKFPPILLIGEAPGHKGCRFSGIPFTSEGQLCASELPFSGKLTSLQNKP